VRLGAFQLYDINDDGLITYDEMLKIVQSIYDMTGDMVKLPSDEDTAEKVSSNLPLSFLLARDEFAKIDSVLQRVNKIFALMDLNKDHQREPFSFSPSILSILFR